MPFPRLYKLFFDALGNKNRIKILDALRGGPMSVSQLCRATRLEQSHVSHNMCCLVTCGFVSVERRGRHRIYSMNGPITRKLFSLIDSHLKRYEDHFCECGVINKKGRVSRHE